MRSTPFKIRLKPDAVMPHKRTFRLSPQRESELRRHVDELLAKGLIRRSKASNVVPMFLVDKKDGKTRPVVDYRPINKETITEKEPLPIIQDMIDKLSGAKVFSVIDIQWGFCNVPMDPDSIQLMTFVTSFGSFEWLVMPFGLKNAPSHFQRELRVILQPFADRGIQHYIDDIIVYSKTTEEHVQLLEELFTLLEKRA